MSEVLNLNAHEMLEQRVNALRYEGELWHEVSDGWPASPDVTLETLEVDASNRSARSYDAIVNGAGRATVARVRINGGMASIQAFARSEPEARELLERLREEIPRTEDSDPNLVPVTFWTYSPRGPRSIRRMIDAPAWADIEENYPSAPGLGPLLCDWAPGFGGQLLLWHGEAGTGKTTALRCLGRQWRDWAELHYIVDPDTFFGQAASYMMDVMMGGSESEPEIPAPDEAQRRPSWRVLVLEDCGEMLAPDARRDVGQALSRLLNACDGLIGRGLRLLILVTTNEPLGKVHPAISRPGRCAARIEFERFTPAQAEAWLGRYGFDTRGGSLSLADLYALREGHRSGTADRPVGFGALQ